MSFNMNKRVCRQNLTNSMQVLNGSTPTASHLEDVKPGQRQIIYLPTTNVPLPQPIGSGGGSTNGTPIALHNGVGVGTSQTATTSADAGFAGPAAEVSLLPEIADIMRSFGDSDHPLEESVKLVQQILREQLRGIFDAASLVAHGRRGNPCPVQGDFEFIMRKHPIKIARMRKHLKDMRILKKFLSARLGKPLDAAEDAAAELSESNSEPIINVPDHYDEERTRRLFRADRISQILSGQKYQEFFEARRTSFYCRHGEKLKFKFHQFLSLPADMQIPISTLNILAYFAHETMAVIVDYAILTRLNSANRVTEPFSRVTTAGAKPSTFLHVCPEVTQGRGMEVVKAITSQEIIEAMRRFHMMVNSKFRRFPATAISKQPLRFLAV